jgi:hypothetical protein
MPSLNTGNAILSNALKVDSSYNVGIGGAADATYKLKVTGIAASNSIYANGDGAFTGGGLFLKQYASAATNITGYNIISTQTSGFLFSASVASSFKNFILDASSLTDVTQRTYTLPNASGTIALLSGTQTFTGATTFSSSVTAVGSLTLNNSGNAWIYANNTSGDYAGMIFRTGGIDKWYMYNYSTASNIFKIASTATDNIIVATQSGNVGIGTSSPSGKLLVVLPTFSNEDTDSQQAIFGVASGFGVRIGYNETSNYGVINVLKPGSAWGKLVLQNNGGNVLIGTTTAGTSKLIISSANDQAGVYMINTFSGNAWSLRTGTPGISNTGLCIYDETNSRNTMQITSNGSVCINASSPGTLAPYLYNFNSDGSRINAAFEVSVATPGFTSIQFRNPNGAVGSININTSTVTYGGTSDYRLKEDLKDFSGLDKVSAIKVYDFKWKVSEERNEGVLAHELMSVIPYAVNGEKDDINDDGSIKSQMVDYSKLVPVLVKAIQELKAEIDELKNR